MGNREALLEGAKTCLFEKGYTRTTARDIATAAQVSLGAIGYHFGSTEALLSQALFDTVAQWGARFGDAVAAGADPEAFWDAVIDSVRTDRPLWAVQYEMVGQVDRSTELRTHLARSHQAAREEIAAHTASDLPADAEDRRRLAALYQAIFGGLVTQWLVDPDNAPTGADIVAALKIAGRSA